MLFSAKVTLQPAPWTYELTSWIANCSAARSPAPWADRPPLRSLRAPIVTVPPLQRPDAAAVCVTVVAGPVIVTVPPAAVTVVVPPDAVTVAPCAVTVVVLAEMSDGAAR